MGNSQVSQIFVVLCLEGNSYDTELGPYRHSGLNGQGRLTCSHHVVDGPLLDALRVVFRCLNRLD